MLSIAGEGFNVIDALDEYKSRSTQRHELCNWIENFRSEPVNTHLLVIRRPELDIKNSIESWVNRETIITL